jgi:DNA-binding XRE family transcriptional regulator
MKGGDRMRERLVAARKALNMTQGQVAAAIGLSRGFLALVEVEKRLPALGYALRLGKVLGVPVEELFPEAAFSMPSECREGTKKVNA